MPLISNIYLILLLPLLAAFSCATIKNKSINHLITVALIGLIIVQLLKIIPIFIDGKYIHSNFSAENPSLILNYKLNIVGLFFAVVILSQKFAIFFL